MLCKYAGEDVHHNIGMLENISQIQWEYFKFVGFAFAYCKSGGRKVDLCYNIGMLENIGQIQWAYFKVYWVLFWPMNVCWQDICHNIGILQNIGQIEWEYLKFVLFAFSLIASMRGRRGELCHNIGMLENISQIQWEYLKSVV